MRNLNRRTTLFLLLVFSIVMISSSTYSIVAAIVDAETLAIRSELNQKKATNSLLDPIQWNRIHLGLSQATSVIEDGSYYWEDLGYLNASRGYAALRFPYIAKPFLKNGIDLYRHAMLTRPMSPVAWANMALMAHYLNNDKMLWEHYEVARKYGGNDIPSQVTLFLICAQRWTTLAENRRNQTKAFYKSASPTLKLKLREIIQAYRLEESLN